MSLWLLLCCQTSLASIPQTEEKIDLDVYNQWKIFVQKQVTSSARGEDILSDLYDYQLEHKIDALPAISNLLLGMASADKKSPNIMKSTYWKFAKRFNPFAPEPHYLICQYGKKTPLLTRLSNCFKGLALEFQLQEGRLFQKAYISHVLHTAILATLLFMMLMFAIKYMPFLSQFFSSKLGWLSPVACGLVGAVVLAGLSLGFGWVFGLTVFVWLIWFFINRLEKFVLVMLLGLVALLPQTFKAPAAYTQYQDQVLHSVHASSSETDLLYKHYRPDPQSIQYQQFISAMFPKTFNRTSQSQLNITLLSCLFGLLILGMFIHISDYYYFYQKREDYTKRMIIKDLKAFPKLYFAFLRSLALKDTVAKISYVIAPPFYFFTQNRPVTAFLLSFALLLSYFGMAHQLRFLEMYHFPWSIIFAPVFSVLMLTLIFIPKTYKNRVFYDKKISSK